MSDKNEKLIKLEGELSSIGSELRDWKDLVESRGWTRFKTMVLEQAKARQAAVCMRPVKSMDQVFEQEFNKGEAIAFQTQIAMAEAEVERLESDVEALNVAITKETENVQAEGDVAGRGASRVDDERFFGNHLGGDEPAGEPGSGSTGG